MTRLLPLALLVLTACASDPQPSAPREDQPAPASSAPAHEDAQGVSGTINGEAFQPVVSGNLGMGGSYDWWFSEDPESHGNEVLPGQRLLILTVGPETLGGSKVPLSVGPRVVKFNGPYAPEDGKRGVRAWLIANSGNERIGTTVSERFTPAFDASLALRGSAHAKAVRRNDQDLVDLEFEIEFPTGTVRGTFCLGLNERMAYGAAGAAGD